MDNTYKHKKRYLFGSVLFFKESEDVSKELDEQIWKRTRIYMYATAVLVALWGVFDVFIDFENLWIFLALRGIYTPLTLLCAYNFHKPIFRNHHRMWAILHYLLLIVDIGVMVLWTDSFVKYLIGFSTIFWGASVIMLWRFWNTVIPGIAVICIAWLRFYFFPHNVAPGEFITGLYYFVTCLIFVSIISAYGYWSAYQLAEKNLTLKKTQEKLFQAEKMASLNMVVASVAHEINTPIGTAITAASHAQEEFESIAGALNADEVHLNDIMEPVEDGTSSIQSALNQLHRTAKLVERLKETAIDQSNDEARVFNLFNYIKDNIIGVGLQPILKKHNISVLVEGDDDLMVDSYPGEYSQVFTNLIMNSIIHGYGEHDDKSTPCVIKIKLVAVNNDEFNIHYSDDGAGMPAEVLNKVFEPFFTTKGSDRSKEGRGHRGSGLGMSIVYNIITQKLHGKINIRSRPGLGTLFFIEVPMKTVKR